MSVIQTDNVRYDAVSTTVATGETNRDMKLNNPTIFLNVSEARYMSITTSQTITVRLNGVAMPWIVVTSSESPKVWKRAEQGMAISNFFVTNASGSSSDIKVELYS